MKKVVFVHAVDVPHDQLEILAEMLKKITEYEFIVSDKEIRAIDKDELLEALK